MQIEVVNAACDVDGQADATACGTDLEVVGRCATEAFFCQPVELDPGSKLRLLIETKNGLRFITTSKIETIKHLRSE